MKSTIEAPSQADAEKRPVEAWRDEMRVSAWRWAGAKFFAKWAIGQLVTKADFEKALSDFDNLEIR
jgi:hypothetical protein